MGTKLYYASAGELLGESAAGVPTTYMSDALGSTVGTINSTGVRNTYAYKPYGTPVSGSNPDPDPRFLWNAESQYRATDRQCAEYYAKRRYVSPADARWTSRDPLWPYQRAYVYVKDNPSTISDRSGMSPNSPCGPAPCKECTPTCNHQVASYCNCCYTQPGGPTVECIQTCNSAAGSYYSNCGKPPLRPGPVNWKPRPTPGPWGPIIVPVSAPFPTPRPCVSNAPDCPPVDPNNGSSCVSSVRCLQSNYGWSQQTAYDTCVGCCKDLINSSPWWIQWIYDEVQACIDNCSISIGSPELPEGGHVHVPEEPVQTPEPPPARGPTQYNQPTTGPIYLFPPSEIVID